MKKRQNVKAIPFSAMKRRALRDHDFRREYEALQPELDLVRAILNARLTRGLTQRDIARQAGTTQSAIARFESGRSNPTLAFASRLSRAVGARLEIRLKK